MTDFGSDQTARCETPFVGDTLVPDWKKRAADQPWAPGMALEFETAHVVSVSDVITAVQPFTLTDNWDRAHLELLNARVLPAVGEVITGFTSLEVVVPAGPPEVMTVEKRFLVKPCTWTASTLEEALAVEDGPPRYPLSLPILSRMTLTRTGRGPAGTLATWARSTRARSRSMSWSSRPSPFQYGPHRGGHL